jgi:hypothetical protein
LTQLGLDNGAGPKATAVGWPAHVLPGLLPPARPALPPMERRWRDLQDTLAAVMAQTMTAWSEAVGAISPTYANAPWQSLTGCAYFIQAVETVQQGL